MSKKRISLRRVIRQKPLVSKGICSAEVIKYIFRPDKPAK